jgi:hypothetical protein
MSYSNRWISSPGWSPWRRLSRYGGLRACEQEALRACRSARAVVMFASLPASKALRCSGKYSLTWLIKQDQPDWLNSWNGSKGNEDGFMGKMLGYGQKAELNRALF